MINHGKKNRPETISIRTMAGLNKTYFHSLRKYLRGCHYIIINKVNVGAAFPPPEMMFEQFGECIDGEPKAITEDGKRADEERSA